MVDLIALVLVIKDVLEVFFQLQLLLNVVLEVVDFVLIFILLVVFKIKDLVTV